MSHAARLKVGMSVDFYFSRIEHDPLHPNRRRVRAFRRFDIANVFRDEIEPGDPQRFKRTFVCIGQIAVVNCKSIDFQRIDSLQSVLPAPIFHRHVVFSLFRKLPEIHVHDGIIDGKIGDKFCRRAEPSSERWLSGWGFSRQRVPDARFEKWLCLRDPGKTKGMKIESSRSEQCSPFNRRFKSASILFRNGSSSKNEAATTSANKTSIAPPIDNSDFLTTGSHVSSNRWARLSSPPAPR